MRGNDDWRRVAVYGLGVSGRAAAALLARRGVEVVAVDRRGAWELDLGGLAGVDGIELQLGREPEELPEVDCLVVSPGIPPGRPLVAAARRRGVPVIAEVELAYRFLDGTVAGITGSNGKSTTTSLTGALLTAAGFDVEVCGNIGRPLSACVDGPPGRLFVVELSSFQLEGIARFRADAGALINLSPDHLDRYPGMDAYRSAKQRLFENQRAADVAVLNADDPLLAGVPVTARRRAFSLVGPVDDGCHLAGGEVVEVAPGGDERRLFGIDDLPLPGAHNVANAMAASLLALALGASAAGLAASLAGVSPLPHRLQLVGERAGVRFYDDSKGTNPHSTGTALEGFADATVHAILGGRSKGGLEALVDVVARKARRAYLIGEAAVELEPLLAGRVPFERSIDLARAVRDAVAHARPGDVVLLSPACASFDQYASYVERGHHFQRLVEALTEEADGQEARL